LSLCHVKTSCAAVLRPANGSQKHITTDIQPQFDGSLSVEQVPYAVHDIILETPCGITDEGFDGRTRVWLIKGFLTIPTA
jgi:hypothetical protein